MIFMAEVNWIEVEVAYALPGKQKIINLQVKPGTTAREAVEQSNVRLVFPQISTTSIKLGIFGKIAQEEDILRAGDRVEIYRGLIADPKEIRKQRAAAGKKMRKGAVDK